MAQKVTAMDIRMASAMAGQIDNVAAYCRDHKISRQTFYKYRHRFREEGLAGLQEAPRSGRPATYGPGQVSEVVATSLTKPQELGLPFASWTLDRLAAYLQEVKGIPIKRSRIDELLLREGLRWRTQETWFGERVDPAFADKRGPSRRSIPRRRRAVS